MPKIDHDTKERILAAAEEVFHLHGLKGARTTLIAEKAGISRTMLHYYYSTKEALFEEVVGNALGMILQHFQHLLGQQSDLFLTIDNMIDALTSLFDKKPHLATFIVNLFNEIPNFALLLSATSTDDLPSQFQRMVEEEQAKGNLVEGITGEDIVLNIYGLCSVAYLGSSYIRVRENRDDAAMQQFFHDRREKIKRLLHKGLKP